uniref:Eukaryotic translation initiation factor 2A n=1 Tax=Kwoniella dejecticola CBS 10117 TaxID=1296121 RepID=A0A1A6AG97_9TREE|nr:translation initiation factor 2A [Kwoniella dejecticola CBS 10117]OBR89084.1 translation initiation factor 2A [Kwoniella dejecticola CBS 10117]
MSATHYAFRAQKTAGIADGPSWEISSRIPADTAATRCYTHSSDGGWLAYAEGSNVHILPSSSSSSSSPVIISQPNVLALNFSPLSTNLFTFERPVKQENGDMHKNVKAWNVKTGEEVGGWYSKSMDGWEPIITSDESHLIRAGASDIAVFQPPLAPRPISRVRVEGVKGIFLSAPTSLAAGVTSSKPVHPHQEPAVAIWIGEKKGAPASISLYPLSSLLPKSSTATANGNGTSEEIKTETKDLPNTVARKAFYKADKLNVKWNNAGTQALFMAQSDVDVTGKSYYGETNLYLVSLDGSFDGLVDLDKEGPIYDFTWSPNSREFVVTYGYMPARVQLFDSKAKPVFSFGSQHRNFLLYQPQGRLLLSAGFGNLAGGVDIWDVSTRNKVAEFKASNSSHCEFSPCGQYILTATLSPRLRVDNGVKIWWCGGQLLHIQPIEELYQASFAPRLVKDIQPFPAVVPKAPEPNESVAKYADRHSSRKGDSKPAGAYRPPGARGTLASDAYSRRDDDKSSPNGSGASTPTPMFRGGKPAGRYIPGSAPPGSAPKEPVNDDKKKRTRKRGKGENEEKPAAATSGAVEQVTEDVSKVDIKDEGDDANSKKIRNLTKKLKAIEDLKTRLAGGEVLERTQVKKIESEQQVRDEIASLGGSA